MSWPVRIATLSKGVRLFPQASAGWDFVRGTYKNAAGYVRTNYLYPTETPSAWASTSTSNGVTVSRVATGVEDGLAYADYRWSGTSTGVASDIRLGSGPYAAAPGQTWSAAYSAKIVAGALPTGGALKVALIELTSGEAYVAETSPSWYPTLSNSAVTRSFSTRTLGGTAGKVQLSAVLGFSSGVAVDVTIRVYAPQLEQTNYPTSFIATGASAVSVTTYSSTNPADVGNMTFTRASTGYAEDAQGNLVLFGSNVPRITSKGVLIEESRTNLALRSQDFSNAAWTVSATVVTTNASTAPDGTSTANLLVPNATSTDHVATQAATHTAASYTVSIYAKPAGYDRIGIRENTTSGAYVVASLTGSGSILANNIGTSAVTAVGNGWYRITMTWTASAVSQQLGFYVVGPGYTSGSPHAYSWSGDGTSGIYFWGAQDELGSFPTSYIPTTSAPVTRPADVFYYSGLSISNVSTIAGAGLAPQLQTNIGRILEISDNGGLGLNIGAGNSIRDAYVGGAGITSAPVGDAVSFGSPTISVASNASGTVRGSGNGKAASALVGTATISTATRVTVGDVVAASRPLNGYIQRLAIYSFAASDAQLQSISSGNF